MINNLIEFEDLLKKYKVLFFDKVYEKTQSKTWKLIYNIQGLTNSDTSFFYPNLKFIFWLNEDKTELTDNVISYLYTPDCEYKSITLNHDSIGKTFEVVLDIIKKNKVNIEFSKFILDGTDEFNKELIKFNKEDFINNLVFSPHGNKSCNDTVFSFKIETNLDTYYFTLKYYKTGWELKIDDDTITVDLNEIYKKIIKHIYATE